MVNRWNGLPAKVVNTESVKSFKNAYDRYCCEDMDDRSWSAAGPLSYKYKYKYKYTEAAREIERPAKRDSVEYFPVAGVDDDDAVRAGDVGDARVLVGRGVVAAEVHAVDGVSERHALRLVGPRKHQQDLQRIADTSRLSNGFLQASSGA